MGYTNFWYQSDSFTNEEWNKIKTVANELVKDDFITGFDGTLNQQPIVDDERIVFNGIEAHSFEPFHLMKNKNDRYIQGYSKGIPELGDPELFFFCKTNRMPYDEHVWKILNAARNAAPDKIRITNDDVEGA